MNNIKQQYLNWKLSNQDKYINLTDLDKPYYISLLEILSEYKDSQKYKIQLNLKKFKLGYVKILRNEEILTAINLITKNTDYELISHKNLLLLYSQLNNVSQIFKKHKLNKLYICDILIDSVSKNPIAIYVIKVNDNGNIYYDFQSISFIYLLFLTSAYKDLLIDVSNHRNMVDKIN